MKIGSMARIVIAMALTVLTGCRSEPPMQVQEVESPAVWGSSGANLTTGPDGRIYLSWMERRNFEAPSFKFAVRTPDGWSEPRTIIENNDLLVNWADFPSLLVLDGDAMAAHWMMTAPLKEGYDVHVAVSNDAGATWSDSVVPHRDGTDTEHGFASLVRDPFGDAGVIWLDSRRLAEPADPNSHGNDVQMMYAPIGRDGAVGEEGMVDARVCECCQTSAVGVPGEVLAVYRDRTEAEIRDTAIVRFDGAQWTAPAIVHADGWEIHGCPINGPAIAAEGPDVVVAWFTAVNDNPIVQAAFSGDGGATFGPAIRIDDGGSVGRVDAVMLEVGAALLTWVERTEGGAEVRARRVDRNGRLHTSFTVGPTVASTASGFPRMAHSAGAVVFAWTDTNENRVRTAVLDMAQ